MSTITKISKTFSPSVNIVRDKNLLLDYVVTLNSKRAFNQLINDYKIGFSSFTLIGAYGIGKSSFLWALEKDLKKETDFFGKTNLFPVSVEGIDFIRIVGSYNSLITAFAEELGLSTDTLLTSKELIKKLDLYYSELQKKKQGLVILIDEFGKHLEFASKNQPEKELYFIQELAEYANNENKNIILITSLHQDFNGYSRELNQSQQNEWDKVKGRLKEITFNEPVEQLLFVASERVEQLNHQQEFNDFDRLFEVQKESNLFPLKDYFNKEIARKLLPFDMLSASIMTIALQKYGQNERSLFSFLESNDILSVKEHLRTKNSYYNLTNVYDYLIHNYYSFLSTKSNPHLVQWGAIQKSIERVEGLFENDRVSAIKLVKTIGLLNLFASASGQINLEFLNTYSQIVLDISEPIKIISELEKTKIIRYVKHSQRYILFEGTDLDIELAIDEAGNLIEQVTNVVSRLEDYFEFNFIPAKSYYYRIGTPRFFQFQLTDEPSITLPEGEVDGFIQLVFSEKINTQYLIDFSKDCEEAILFAWYKETHDIRNTLYELSKINKVIAEHQSDSVAIRELENIARHQRKLLNHYVINGMYSDDDQVQWFFKGERIKITSSKLLNQKLSEISHQIYSSTPVFRNEMVNKTKLSPPINTARKSLIKNLVSNWELPDLGYEGSSFPPDRTIYLSLLRETGIHSSTTNIFGINKPSDHSFDKLWVKSEEFLSSSKYNRRNVNDLIEILLKKPFKLKRGFIEFWVPLFLFTKRDDFALFDKNGYIPDITASTLDILVKNPKDYFVKAFDIAGVKLDLFNKYRSLLEQTEKDKVTNQSFIETIKPFLKFYRDIPDYAKHTSRLSKKSIALRSAIANAKDPEKSFFEEFPIALGYNTVKLLSEDKSILKEYESDLRNSIREIRICYDELVDRMEVFLTEQILGEKSNFPEYKDKLQLRFKSIKKHLLKPNQKTFFQRLMSPLDDRNAWMNSIIQCAVSKDLKLFTDDDEIQAYDKLFEMFQELDNLCELSTKEFNADKEEIIKVEVTSFVEGLQKNFIRLSKDKMKEVELQQEILKKLFVNDKRVNIAALANLLQAEISKK